MSDSAPSGQNKTQIRRPDSGRILYTTYVKKDDFSRLMDVFKDFLLLHFEHFDWSSLQLPMMSLQILQKYTSRVVSISSKIGSTEIKIVTQSQMSRFHFESGRYRGVYDKDVLGPHPYFKFLLRKFL